MKTKNDILIKVLSLGVGLAVGIVLIAKVFFELSYDSFYKDINRVYNINTWISMQGNEKDYSQVSGAVAVGFMEEVPGVEAGTRTTFVFNGDTYLDEDGNKLSGTLVCADTCFFQVFDRPILSGDPVKVLGKWGSVMVNPSFAEKIGGVQECIGKQIANADKDGLKLTVEWVFEDFPKNGSLDYDILLSMDSYGKNSTDNWLGNDRYKGYVKLMPGVDPATLSDAIRKMQEAHQPLEQIERGDGVINICEMKWSSGEFTITKKDDAELRNKVEVFQYQTDTKSAIMLTMITAFGVKHNMYYDTIQSEITIDQMFV